MKKSLNQKLINLFEYYNLNNCNLLLSNVPIKRYCNDSNQTQGKTKLERLQKLKRDIQ